MEQKEGFDSLLCLFSPKQLTPKLMKTCKTYSETAITRAIYGGIAAITIVSLWALTIVTYAHKLGLIKSI